MTLTPNRRDLMKAALGGAAGLALPFGGLSRAYGAGSGNLSVTRLAPDMVMIAGAGGNVVAAADEDGVVMVDGGRADMSQALLETVRETFPGKSVRTLFNTHWHREQTGSNRELGWRGTPIIAHANTRLWLGTDIKRPWEDRTFEPLPPEARPTEIVYNTGTLPFAGGQIEYGYLRQAHTDGDVYVYFPDQNVLHAGGALTSDRWPLVDWWTGGWVGGLAEGLDTLVRVTDADTRVVPASGPVTDRAEIEAQRDMYLTIYKRLREMLYNARSPEEAVAAGPAKEFEGKMGPSDAFVEIAFKSMWGHFSPDA